MGALFNDVCPVVLHVEDTWNFTLIIVSFSIVVVLLL